MNTNADCLSRTLPLHDDLELQLPESSLVDLPYEAPLLTGEEMEETKEIIPIVTISAFMFHASEDKQAAESSDWDPKGGTQGDIAS